MNPSDEQRAGEDSTDPTNHTQNPPCNQSICINRLANNIDPLFTSVEVSDRKWRVRKLDLVQQAALTSFHEAYDELLDVLEIGEQPINPRNDKHSGANP